MPVDFARVIVDERLAGGFLLDPESDEVFEAGEAGEPGGEGWRRYGVESYVCLRLIHATKHSISTGAAIAFC